MALTPSLIKSLQSFFFSAKKDIKLTTKLGVFLQDFQDLGNINHSAKVLSFDTVQKKDLKNALESIYGEQILLHDFSNSSYLQAAKISNQEKLAGVKPSDNYVLLKLLADQEVSSKQHKVLPSNIGLRILIDDIDLLSVKNVVVIENLTAFDHIHLANLPQQLMSALFIYRGHEESNSKGLIRLLKKLPKTCQIIAFTDFDPAGLKIALTLPNVNACLLPEINQELNSTSHQEDFDKQHASMVFLQNQPSPNLQKFIRAIEVNRLSIKQEHMLVTKTPLFLQELN